MMTWSIMTYFDCVRNNSHSQYQVIKKLKNPYIYIYILDFIYIYIYI